MSFWFQASLQIRFSNLLLSLSINLGAGAAWTLVIGVGFGVHTAFPHTSSEPPALLFAAHYFPSRLSNMYTSPNVAVFCAMTGVVPFTNDGMFDWSRRNSIRVRM